MMTPDEIFEYAIKEAEMLMKLKPLIEAVEKNPISYAQLIAYQSSEIIRLKKELEKYEKVVDTTENS